MVDNKKPLTNDLIGKLDMIKDWTETQMGKSFATNDPDKINELKGLLDQVKSKLDIGGNFVESDYVKMASLAAYDKTVEQQKKSESGGTKKQKFDHNKTNQINNIMKRNLSNDANVNNNISSMFHMEYERFVLYNNYRTIVDLIPFLDKILNTFIDNIISPDDTTKKGVNIVNNNVKLNDDEKEEFNDNITLLRDKYNIDIKLMKYIRNSLKIGDEFVLVMKLSDELNNLFLKEDGSLREAYSSYYKGDMGMVSLTESTLLLDETDNAYIKSVIDNIDAELKIKFTVDDVKKMIVEYSNYFDYTENPFKLISEKVQMDRNFKANKPLQYNDVVRNIFNKKPIASGSSYADGLVSDKDSYEFSYDELNGSIIKRLEPERIIKLKKDDYVYGYYYIEDLASPAAATGNINKYSTLYSLFTSGRYNSDGNARKDQLIYDIFVKNIVTKINKKFILDNKELKDGILAVLRHNKLIGNKNKMRFTYLADSNVVHFKGDDINETSIDDTYGTSIFKNILFTAKIYIATLANTLMVKLVRGVDKRVFYIQSGIEKDHEAVIDEFVRTMKMGALKMSDLNDINYVLRVIGEFEDYYIPIFDGEKPLEMDIIQGQDVDVKNDFLDYLRRAILSGMGVPSAFIDALDEIELAKALTMMNQAFVSDIITKQKTFERPASKFVRILYENEFMLISNDEKRKLNEAKSLKKKSKKKSKKNNKLDNSNYTDDNPILLKDIAVAFPAPTTMNYQNINDMISNSQNIIDNIITTLMPDDKEFENDEDGSKLKRYNEVKARMRVSLSEIFIPSVDWIKYKDLIKSLDKEVIYEKAKDQDRAPKDDTFDSSSATDTPTDGEDAEPVNKEELEGDNLSSNMDDMLPE